MVLRSKLRINDKNKKYAIALAISLTTLLLLQYFSTNESANSKGTGDLDYTYSESDIKEMIKQQIKDKAEEIFQSAKALSNYFHEEEDCEDDQNYETENNALDLYLDTRKKCLLKYCGNVCETEDGENRGMFSN